MLYIFFCLSMTGSSPALIPSEGRKVSVCPCSGTIVAMVSKNIWVLLEPTRAEVPSELSQGQSLTAGQELARVATLLDGSNLPILELRQRCSAVSSFLPAWQG